MDLFQCLKKKVAKALLEVCFSVTKIFKHLVINSYDSFHVIRDVINQTHRNNLWRPVTEQRLCNRTGELLRGNFFVVCIKLTFLLKVCTFNLLFKFWRLYFKKCRWRSFFSLQSCFFSHFLFPYVSCSKPFT
jgi:hypothetical protein